VRICQGPSTLVPAKAHGFVVSRRSTSPKVWGARTRADIDFLLFPLQKETIKRKKETAERNKEKTQTIATGQTSVIQKQGKSKFFNA